ncbi:hypothetical protein GCM10023100_04920 [Actinocorallia cavernae]|uniref:Novel STAND NTPase 1 domain-containing protein n=1 Tax=Actinocorallia cavernae TaxID=328075 RepID=A0ABP8SA70_9ACTN
MGRGIVASDTEAGGWNPKVNPEVLGASPFRGLLPLQESDAEVFFGRDDEVEQVIAVLSERSPVILCGPSGCGKSSLVAAGVVPRMRQVGCDVVVLNSSMFPTLRRALAIELCKTAVGRRAQGTDVVEAVLARRGLMNAFSIVRGGTRARRSSSCSIRWNSFCVAPRPILRKSSNSYFRNLPLAVK